MTEMPLPIIPSAVRPELRSAEVPRHCREAQKTSAEGVPAWRESRNSMGFELSFFVSSNKLPISIKPTVIVQRITSVFGFECKCFGSSTILLHCACQSAH